MGVLELLERDALLEALGGGLAEAGAGRGRLVLLGGEAGVGKTALLRAFCVPDLPAHVLWGACERLFTPRALGPFLDIADAAGVELPDLAPHARAPYELLGALVDELGRRPPTVLVVEDVHWADVGTLDVIKLLARRIDRLPVLALVSFRDDHFGPAAPLQIILGELGGAPAVERRHIPPLSRDAVRALAQASGADPDRLFERTGGNPFFVTEALAAMDVEIPDTVRGAVLARAAQLASPARWLLEVAAVVPSRIELWLLEAIAARDLAGLDECLSSGMLRHEGGAVEFRHELARLAIEEAIAPHRRIGLHRAVLAALSSGSPHGAADPARLSHHADAAGDVDAVLRHAPAAGERAAELCAHHEAAQQFARALRHPGLLSAERRAYLWERRSYECYLTQQIAEAVKARREALALHRAGGDRLREGDSHRWLSRLAWFGGDRSTAVLEARRAVELLEAEPPSRELAMAYSNQAQLCMLADDTGGAVDAGSRAIELAERLGESEILIHALNNVGAAEVRHATAGAVKLERSLALALEAGLEEHVARGYTNLTTRAVWGRDYAAGERHLAAGLAYSEEHDLEPWVAYMTGWLARMRFEQGQWDEAAEDATDVLRGPNVAVPSRITPLIVLGRLRARRGDPGAWALLDEALELARPTEELQRLAPVAAARAEAHWLDGDLAAVARETDQTLALALEVGDRWAIGELGTWRRRAGIEDQIGLAAVAAAPYAHELRGDWEAAARAWDELGCPYEAALARADSGEQALLEDALAAFQRLGAVPAARASAQRLRVRGVKSIARGPRRSTINNPGQLTSRQIEILELLAEGLTNAEIAARLYIAPKTVAHHVSAILGKLDVVSRKQAAAEVTRLGLAMQK